MKKYLLLKKISSLEPWAIFKKNKSWYVYQTWQWWYIYMSEEFILNKEFFIEIPTSEEEVRRKIKTELLKKIRLSEMCGVDDNYCPDCDDCGNGCDDDCNYHNEEEKYNNWYNHAIYDLNILKRKILFWWLNI